MKVFLFFISLLMLVACEQESVSERKISSDKKPMAAAVNKKDSIETIYKAELVPEKMTVQEKKKRFRYLIVPAVKKVFAELRQQHQKIEQLIKSGTDSLLIKKLKTEYKAESDKDLLARLKPHPVSIVLAQAAMESAWATSRFFVEAKNIFGVWSFDKNEPRIAAAEKRGKKTIWLKKYRSIEDAIRDNYRVLARGNAFKKFRQMRSTSDNPFELVKGLDKYSELGSKYGKELAAVIKYNKFNQYDLKSKI